MFGLSSGKLMVNVYITIHHFYIFLLGIYWFMLEKLTSLWKDPPFFFSGKTHDFDWAMFNSYVKLPEGRLDKRR